MCRKLSSLILVAVVLAVLNSAFAGQELKVDLAHTGDSSTQKPGWIIWAEHDNEQYHDMYHYYNLGGTGIEARLSVGVEGKGAMGKSSDGAEPICNTFYFHFDMGEDHPTGDVLLGFYNIPAGVYSLKSYHRHPDGLSNMPRIDVNCVYLVGYKQEKWDGDANCTGVTQIPTGDGCDVNVPIPGDTIYDDNLPSSLVKFETDGSNVLVRYWSQGETAVLNAFILEALSTPDTAWGPDPGHASDLVCPDANLSWGAGNDANSHNLYLGTDLTEEYTIFEDSFEAGLDANWTASNWTQYDANEDANSHWGRYSAAAGSGVGTLTSDALDASEAGSLRVELWIRTLEGIESGDIDLYYYDGNNWDFIADLNSVAEDNAWRRFTDEVTDSQYFVSTFKLELRSNISGGEVFIDDVSVDNTWPLNSQWFVGNQDPCSYNPPGLLDLDTTYYWRVDEVNTTNPNSPWKGFLWNFTTEDGKARNPSPANRAGSIPLGGTTLSWTPSCLASKHDVYFSSNFDDVNTGSDPNSGAGKGRQPQTTYGTGALTFGTRYYWRIDEVGAAGLIRGDVWTFQTTGYPLMHYKFDGVMDSNIPLPITDFTGNVTFDRGGGYGSGPGGQLKYDEPNPIVNPDGTCAHFMPQTGAPNIPGGAVYLRRKVAGSDILDLDGSAYTIEMWVRQDGPARRVDDDDYAATLFRKYESSYVVAIGEDGAVRYVHGGYGASGRRLESEPDVIELGEWYHIAAVFDQNDPNQAQKLYVGGLLVDDGNSTVPNPSTDDDPTTIAGRIPPLSEDQYLENVFDGAIDELRVSDLALDPSEFLLQGDPNLAWLPRPANRAKDVQYDVDLEWLPGQYVSSHDVYIGTSWDDINDVNSSNYLSYPNVDYNNVDVNMEDIPYLLDLEKTYYWRVDEVNDTTNDKWRGRIWRFTVAEYITIDDMEDYTQTKVYPIAKLQGASTWGWDSAYENGTGGLLFLSCAECTWGQLDHSGDQAMYYFYDVTSDYGSGYYYAEISNRFDLDPNWTYAGVRMLALWFHGDPCNSASGVEQMYVGLEDSSGISSYSEVRYGAGEGEDVDDITIDDWQQWSIPLSSFTQVDLTDVEKLYIGFGERYGDLPGGSGNVYFDDIRLYPPTCVPSKRSSQFAELDLDDDCIIGFGDVEIIADEWLVADVNLGQVSEPCDANLVGWWKFDEGSGSTASDSSTYNNNGTLEIVDVNVFWVTDGHDGNALEFDDGRVRVPDAEELRPMEQVSVSAWVKYDDEQEDGRVVVKGGDDNETYQLEVDDDDDLKFHIRDGNDYDPCDNEYRGYMVESDNDAIERDEWTHVAGTFDANTLKCYVNGELAGENNDPNLSKANFFLHQDTNDLGIGMRPDDTDNEFEGIIDDVRIYDYGLSQAEVAYLATDGTGILEVQSIANLINDEQPGKRAVNLRDLAILADDWLVQELFP